MSLTRAILGQITAIGELATHSCEHLDNEELVTIRGAFLRAADVIDAELARRRRRNLAAAYPLRGCTLAEAERKVRRPEEGLPDAS